MLYGDLGKDLSIVNLAAPYLFIQTPLDRRGMASFQSNSTFSFKHHLTGEAFLAWYLYIVRTSTIAKNQHLNIVLQAELYLRTGTYRPWAGAAPRSVPTQQTVYVVAPTLQLLTISLAKPFFQTPLDRRGTASLQSNSTFSFKHHLTGEAWPACRAIIPFHSNTT